MISSGFFVILDRAVKIVDPLLSLAGVS